MQINMIPYVKYLVLKVDMFETKIVDEKNFNQGDDFEIKSFKKRYENPCFLIIKVDM